MDNKHVNDSSMSRLSDDLRASESQNDTDFARYVELVAKFKVPQFAVDCLACEINKAWWTANRNRFIN